MFGLINQLKSHEATRDNNVESRFIKLVNPVIARFLNEIFNPCLTTGTYPDAMKMAEVIPLVEKGDRDKTTKLQTDFITLAV